MAEEKRKKILELPMKILFNDEGISFFVKSNKKLTKFKQPDESEAYGIFFDTFSPPSVQKMMLINYIHSMEISRPEFLSKRQDVLDLSKLITYGTLYRRFDSTVYAKVLDSPVVRHWNQANPSSIIDRKTNLAEAVLLQALEKNKAPLAALRQEIIRSLVADVQANENLQPEEKNIQLFLAEKYLSILRPLVWFILVKFKDSPELPALLTTIEGVLKAFMLKSKLSEHLSLMTVELAVMVENNSLQAFSKTRYKGTLDPMAVMYDPEMRKMITEEMRVRNHNVFLSWRVGGEKLQVKIFNKEVGGLDLPVKPRTLAEFYKDNTDETTGSTELGLYYLTYLTAECQKVGVAFDSQVQQVKESGLTIMTLNLQF